MTVTEVEIAIMIATEVIEIDSQEGAVDLHLVAVAHLIVVDPRLEDECEVDHPLLDAVVLADVHPLEELLEEEPHQDVDLQLEDLAGQGQDPDNEVAEVVVDRLRALRANLYHEADPLIAGLILLIRSRGSSMLWFRENLVVTISRTVCYNNSKLSPAK